MYKLQKFCPARKGPGTSLTLQCDTGLVLGKVVQEITTETKEIFFQFFHSFIYSLPTEQDCAPCGRIICLFVSLLIRYILHVLLNN